MRRIERMASWRKIQRRLRKTKSVAVVAAEIGVHPESLGRMLRRDHAAWWAEERKAWRRLNRNARSLRYRHRRAGREYAAIVRADPRVWPLLTPWQQVRVSENNQAG